MVVPPEFNIIALPPHTFLNCLQLIKAISSYLIYVAAVARPVSYEHHQVPAVLDVIVAPARLVNLALQLSAYACVLTISFVAMAALVKQHIPASSVAVYAALAIGSS